MDYKERARRLVHELIYVGYTRDEDDMIIDSDGYPVGERWPDVILFIGEHWTKTRVTDPDPFHRGYHEVFYEKHPTYCGQIVPPFGACLASVTVLSPREELFPEVVPVGQNTFTLEEVERVGDHWKATYV